MRARGGGEAGAGGRPDAAVLRERLRRSRAGLLEALGRLTEQDFAGAAGDGRSVLELIADLAPAERADAARALAGGGAGDAPVAAGGARRALIAAQAIHDLAGARRGTLRALAALEEAGRPASALEAIAEREERSAAAIRARSPARPPDGARRAARPPRGGGNPRA